MAQQKGSQLDADAMKPKTMAIARLKNPLAIKPKAPVRLACICGKRKHALMSAVPRRIVVSGKEILVLYISVRNRSLVFSKNDGCFVVGGGNLVHHDVCGEMGGQRVIADTVVLSRFDYQSLSCMVALWRECA